MFGEIGVVWIADETAASLFKLDELLTSLRRKNETLAINTLNLLFFK